MSRNLKYFLIPLLLSIFFWWGANVLSEDSKTFFYGLELANDPRLLAAEANQLAFQQQMMSLKPLRDEDIPNIEIAAKSAISLLINNRGEKRILFEKDKNTLLPIASLTKLMTAKVVLDNYDLLKEIKISKEAINQEENLGKLSLGEVHTVKYLLYPLLIESSNDAAYALANNYEGMTEKDFLRMMNEKAGNFKLQNTHFFNPTGLDPEDAAKPFNYSTALDLAKLVASTFDDKLLWEILNTPKFNSYGPELVNTNELLGELPRIAGGKTGYTEKAQGCFILVLEAPRGRGYIINVILGTNNRFSEMKKLANWLDIAYSW
ncbi:MAG: D-alanyl-D-alanine carboxypeptidase [Candidatus Nealsonbacteria bacterium]|nr:D-alanyl-D-alanine carboxypeptidase [Candidatus Nealsonbacteria bacterium]